MAIGDIPKEYKAEFAPAVLRLEMAAEIHLWQERWDKAVRENERLRAALGFYADQNNWMGRASKCFLDCGETASIALRDK